MNSGAWKVGELRIAPLFPKKSAELLNNYQKRAGGNGLKIGKDKDFPAREEICVGIKVRATRQ